MNTNTGTTIRDVWRRRATIGTGRAVREIGSIINERGIEAAGERSLPFYWFVGYLGLSFAVLFGGVFAGTALELPVTVLSVAVLVALTVAWPLSAAIVYWDCAAAERYANVRFTFGKVVALAAIVMGPAAVFYHLIYRGLKLR